MAPNSKMDDKVREALFTKIQSKMDVSKFFAGFFTIFVGLSSKELVSALAAHG